MKHNKLLQENKQLRGKCDKGETSKSLPKKKQEIKKNWTGDNKSTQGGQTGRVTQMKLKEKNENNSYK